MRIGYWRTLIRRLRAKVARGENTYVHPDGVFSIATVCASLDVVLEAGSQLRLAEDAQGNFLLLEVSTARVVIIYPDEQRLRVSEDLVKFINALRSLAPPGLELGAIVDEKLDHPRSRRGVLDDF
ncbi:MAG TPA: hypothetical protein VNW52_00625 [Burkholderiaceae bacterium]|nr:hypothetical protein [Burkholderiaceae bacterium]